MNVWCVSYDAKEVSSTKGLQVGDFELFLVKALGRTKAIKHNYLLCFLNIVHMLDIRLKKMSIEW